ncbi:MAG: hypothetical protein FJ170_01385 [Gammaproteobacteria bacterium]|nr:hypothetical protein [Gammaproteobacteria bacterium]
MTPVTGVHVARERGEFIPAHFNSGGPCSRRRTEQLSATVLGKDDGAIRCPRVVHLGLDFCGRDPLIWAEKLLRQCGFETPDAARLVIPLPTIPCICRPDVSHAPERVDRLFAKKHELLRHALMLGLCTAWCYDPARPVLWTRTSLSRRLELFDGEGFYA